MKMAKYRMVRVDLKKVKDASLIQYVLEHFLKNDIRSLYESFCEQGRMVFDQKESDQDENDAYIVLPACNLIGKGEYS